MEESRMLRGTSFICVALIVLLSSVAVRGADAPTAGHRMLIGDDSKRHVAIVSADGKIEWEYPVGPIHDLHMLPNGNILLQTNFQKIAEVSPDKKVVWSYDSAKMNGNEGKKVEVHAFQRLPDGNTMIAESGIGRIIEVDKDGKIVHEIKMKREHPATHSDTRLARKLSSGNYLVSHEADGAIREYDKDGTVVWEYPIPLFDKPRAGGHGPEAWGNQTFGCVRLANGNTLISTGNGHSIIEVDKDKKVVWHLKPDELPGIQLAWVTTLQVLPNGNILFGNCHAGPANPQIIEITRDKKIVWSFKDFTNFGNSMPNNMALDVQGESIR
jgi:hypothetical protein